jgi:TonB family protein
MVAASGLQYANHSVQERGRLALGRAPRVSWPWVRHRRPLGLGRGALAAGQTRRMSHTISPGGSTPRRTEGLALGLALGLHLAGGTALVMLGGAAHRRLRKEPVAVELRGVLRWTQAAVAGGAGAPTVSLGGGGEGKQEVAPAHARQAPRQPLRTISVPPAGGGDPGPSPAHAAEVRQDGPGPGESDPVLPPGAAAGGASGVGAAGMAEMQGRGAEGAGPGGAGGGAGQGSKPGPGSGGDPQRLLALVRNKIRSHRRYPELARRRGIEGKVEVSFRILPDGRVTELVVRRGADPILDEAALAAVRAASPLPPFPELLTVELDFGLEDEPAAGAPAALQEEEGF